MDISVGNSSIAPQAPEGMQFAPMLRLLRRRAWLIGLFAVLSAAGAYAYARTVPKSYTATSLIAVEGDHIAIPELQGALRSDSASDPLPWVRTEMQAIASRDLMQVVVDKLNLQDVPEFNPSLQQPTVMQQIKDRIQSFFPKQPGVEPPSSPREAVLGSALRGLAIFQDNRSLVIEVSFVSHDPVLAAKIVNTLVTEYISARAQRRAAATQGANTSLTERIDQVRQDLAGLEKEMRDLRTKGDLVGTRAGSVGQQQVEELATAATRATVERAQLQTNYERAVALSSQGSSDALANVLGSGTVSRLRDQEATASRRLAELTTRYGSGHPSVRSAQAEVATAQRQLREETGRIVASLGTQLRAARENEANMQKQLENARRTGVSGENSRAQLDQLQQEITTRRTLYQTLLERAQQTVVQPSGNETPDVRVVAMAAPPASPTSPNMKIAAGAGGVAGAMLGCLAVLARVSSAGGFDRPADFMAAGLPIPGVVSRAVLGRSRRQIRAMPVPGGKEAEGLRTLRFRLARLGQVSAPRSAVFTGLRDRDDAARVAVALARTAALDGDRVLLIEGDLASPRAAGLLGAAHDGLVEALQGNGKWLDQVSHDTATPLQVLATVQPAARAHVLLGSTAFQNLLIEAQAQYDLVVLTAPATGQGDTLTLARHADAVVLVICAADPQEPARAAASRLGAMSRNPVATVLIEG
jgi:succinoglycan biosynthesis transport protein ExoP